MDSSYNSRYGLSGTSLKMIAIVTMLTDHIGSVIMPVLIDSASASTLDFLLQTTDIMRLLGRLAFPIFCFLLVEGFTHTKSVTKYFVRLFAFAIISEVAFDLAFSDKFFEWDSQNVFFTLAIGLMALIAIRYFKDKLYAQIPIALALLALAYILETDYGAMGVITILLFYTLRNKVGIMVLAVAAWMFIGMVLQNAVTYIGYGMSFLDGFQRALSSGQFQFPAALSLILILCYSGKKGISLPKYLFYGFYPVHLLLLYIIANFLL